MFPFKENKNKFSHSHFLHLHTFSLHVFCRIFINISQTEGGSAATTNTVSCQRKREIEKKKYANLANYTKYALPTSDSGDFVAISALRPGVRNEHWTIAGLLGGSGFVFCLEKIKFSTALSHDQSV